MPALQIWGRSNSLNVQKVLWCCEEMALPYERIDAGGSFGVVQSPQYRKLNPNGLVPTIVDDGFVLWESNVIVRYLAARYAGAALWSNDAATRAKADCWMDWSITALWPQLRPLFLGLVRTAPGERDVAALESARRNTADALTIVDAHLATHEYVAGDALSIGDIPLGCVMWRWMALPIDRPRLSNLERWFDTLGRRPGYRKIVMHPLS